jgi:hypothetical protein
VSFVVKNLNVRAIGRKANPTTEFTEEKTIKTINYLRVLRGSKK